MKDKIKEMIEEKDKDKTIPISLTLRKRTVEGLDEEMKRLKIKSRSFMIEMIISQYFDMPITDEKEEGKK